MARAGRKPVPTAIKQLQGNPGKRAMNANEPEVAALDKVPSPPDHLDRIAKSEWRRVAKELHASGVLTSLDLKTLEAYCACYARWREAEKIVKAEGITAKTSNGNIIQHPALGVANTALKEMSRHAAELGMTPSSRSRVTTAKKQDDANPFMSFN